MLTLPATESRREEFWVSWMRGPGTGISGDVEDEVSRSSQPRSGRSPRPAASAASRPRKPSAIRPQGGQTPAPETPQKTAAHTPSPEAAFECTDGTCSTSSLGSYNPPDQRTSGFQAWVLRALLLLRATASPVGCHFSTHRIEMSRKKGKYPLECGNFVMTGFQIAGELEERP